MTDLHSKQTILLVDDQPQNIDVLAEILSADYKVKIALNGKKALEIAQRGTPPDLILLDIMMPVMDGYEVIRHLKSDPATEKVPVIFITAKNEVDSEKKGFELGAVDFITKPVSPPLVVARVHTHLALYDQQCELEKEVTKKTHLLRKANEDLKNSSQETIYRLTSAAEYRDEDTGEHIQRMSNYSATVARTMGLNEEVVEWILYAAPMHDIGKIGIPDRILLKPGKLDAKEWEIMKQHTTIGGKILQCSKAGYIRLGEVIALTHHERWDGTGYPKGLKGKQIPLVGQIVAIADVFDALTTRRPYKEPFSLEKSYGIIREGRGSHFKPEVVDAFFEAEKEILDIKERYQEGGTSLLYQIQADLQDS